MASIPKPTIAAVDGAVNFDWDYEEVSEELARQREAGLKQFAARCAGCHGADGRGLAALGSPNLTDDIWLYGGGRERVRQAILFGRSGQMPAHDALLDGDEIRVVAAYVYGLSAHDGAAK